MKSKLKIVSDKNDGGLFINNNGNLSYSTNEGLVVVDELGSNDRPIYLSELFNKLNDRRWNNVIRKFVDSEGRLYFEPVDLLSNMTEDDIIDFDSGIYKKPEDKELVEISDAGIPLKQIDTIIKYYNEIEAMNETGITLYNSSKIVIDFINNSVSLDLLGKDEYTNTISLVGIEKKQSRPGVSAKIDLTISYTKDEVVYKEDLNFEALNYIEEDSLPKLQRNNFISQVGNGEILVEYIDGIIRVIPASDLVDECIISNCIMTYGNL